MCGIVGLQLRETSLRPRLGALLSPMLVAMSERGPDSAGVAIFDDPDGNSIRYSLRSPSPGYDWESLALLLQAELGYKIGVRRVAGDAVLTASDDGAFLDVLESKAPDVGLVGYGRNMEIFKDVGDSTSISKRYDIPNRGGYQGLGHTRMATESAVTTAHSHPFASGADFCLVHNGSFSNYASVRRDLADEGIVCTTDNDSEVAARFIAHRMTQGSDLRAALHGMMEKIDGFFTLLVATRNQLAVVRDQFACKPAAIAECEDYVAMASEYHALASLPEISEAKVFEPMPGEIYLWSL